MDLDEDDKWLYGDNENESAHGEASENPPAEEGTQSKDDFNLDEEASSEVSQDVSKTTSLQPPEVRNDDEEEEEEKEEDKLMSSAETGEIIEKPGKENGELDDDDEEDEDDEEDDSDEDNVNVIIGDINKSGPTYTNLNIPKRGPAIPAPGIKSTQGKFSIEEFESVGVINGVPAHEYNLDGIEDKPWRMPGADITDYFNYGFNEETWKAYCERQKRIRIHESCAGLPMQTMSNQSWSNTTTTTTQYSSTTAPTFQSNKKPGWETGQIRVIGSGVASRRVDEGAQENSSIQVLPPNNEFSGMAPNMMPPIIPPMEIPPPGFNPSAAPYGGPPPPNDYFNPEPDYFSSYEPTAADQWRDSWAPGTLVTPGPNVKTLHDNSPDDGRKDRDGSRERSRDLDRDDKDRKRDRSHRRSRSRSHERKRNKSRSRSPSHKKHKKKSKKSDKDKDKDKKKRGDDSD